MQESKVTYDDINLQEIRLKIGAFDGDPENHNAHIYIRFSDIGLVNDSRLCTLFKDVPGVGTSHPATMPNTIDVGMFPPADPDTVTKGVLAVLQQQGQLQEPHIHKAYAQFGYSTNSGVKPATERPSRWKEPNR